MLRKGYSVSFANSACYIYDSCGVELARIKMVENSFPITWNSPCLHAVYVSKSDEISLWHKRYGHFNLKSLKFLQTNELVRDLPEIHVHDDVCSSCQFGKLHGQVFPINNSWRASHKLELVHTDVCGPMKVASLGQNLYFILFIDDYTRMTWVYFMSSKAQVFSVFKKFKVLVENQSGYKIKTLRSDNGKEYTSKEFDSFCEDAGIAHQLTVPYTPQQNGVSERKNRTIMEMARCVLHEKKLPKNFWAEVVYTAIYLLNGLPTKAVQGKTPIEAWFGVKPSAHHLKIFGSICYTHVPDAKRTKLDVKAEIGILVGYSTKSKGYREYDLQSGKISVHRDVQVDEDSHWDWDKRVVVKNGDIAFVKDDVEASKEEILASNVADVDAHHDSPVMKTKSLSEIYERCNLAVLEPNTYAEASKHDIWRHAMQEEMQMITKNETWELTSLPPEKNAIGVKWVFRTKMNPDGSIHKHKARLFIYCPTNRCQADASDDDDVNTGIIFLGIRLYMLEPSNRMSSEHSTALVLLSTRNLGGYKSVKEKLEPDAQGPETGSCKIHPQNTEQFERDRLKFDGPAEAMTLANHPVKGLYFMVAGVPRDCRLLP
ncbi:hypothetical protein SLEP1_g6772 [Rubroshorea leprosula]|uniref:Integrase catalytic domain-containing protein n=1 Tax=Rubroshorea leprosula TaxID=152421 RepID=A0AAV5I595_9ROSI|nr:hypothetical protein SLEP1_g6772 [Rubroshorea leprosula]